MKYNASLDTTAKIVTGGIAVLGIAITFTITKELIGSDIDLIAIIFMSGVFLLFPSLLLICWLYAPQSYTLSDASITINRIRGRITIPLDTLESVKIIYNNSMKWPIRTFGVGGVFGYYGYFYHSSIGNFSMYASQRNNKVLLTTKQGKKIIITPDDLGLVQQLQR